MSSQLIQRGLLLAVSSAAILCLLTLFEPASVAVGDSHADESDTKIEKVELAKLALEVKTHQVTIARAELELLESKQQAAKYKVELASANLAIETISFENTNSLFEKHVVSSKEKQMQAAKRDAAQASLSVAKAEHEAAIQSIALKKQNIELLELRTKAAEVALKRVQK